MADESEKKVVAASANTNYQDKMKAKVAKAKMKAITVKFSEVKINKKGNG